MRSTLLPILLFAMPSAASAFPGVEGATCSIKGGVFELDMGLAKAPTYAAVLLPDGRLMRLRYLPDHIDTLGPEYSTGHLSVRLQDLVGVDSKSHRVPVFGMPGTYKFILQDANTAEGMELHRLQCSVALTKIQVDGLNQPRG